MAEERVEYARSRSGRVLVYTEDTRAGAPQANFLPCRAEVRAFLQPQVGEGT